MSFDNRSCPCGGKKEAGVMLCESCNTALEDYPEMGVFQNEKATTEARRASAIKLLAMARRRNRPAWMK